MRKQKKGLTYNILKEWIWSVTQNLVGQSSLYNKVIFIDEHRWNEFKSFTNAHNVQMGTQWKCSKLSCRVDAIGPSSGINGTWVSLWLFLECKHQVMILDMNLVEYQNLIFCFVLGFFVCWLFNKLTGFFFLNTKKVLFFLSYSFFFLETIST